MDASDAGSAPVPTDETSASEEAVKRAPWSVRNMVSGALARSRRATLGAAGIIVVALVAQLWTIDYGTRVNDVPYVAEYPVKSDLTAGSALNRNVVASASAASREQPDLWALRYKLYSIEADEIVNIMALARINQHRTRPDPGFYLYGGAYIYPLGAWYYALTKARVLDISNLQGLLADPQRMDRVWIFGRLFTLLAFLSSAALFYLILRRVTSIQTALILLGLYVTCPASVLFSQIMKPHWYALLWVNLALLVLVKGFQGELWTRRSELMFAVGIGLAVGSAATFTLFALLAWCALLLLVRRQLAPRAALIRTPTLAIIVFAATNPYWFLNWRAAATERANAEGWYRPSLSWTSLASFVDNALLTSVGVALSIVLGTVLLWRVVRPASQLARLYALAILLALVFGSVATASMAHWHTNMRYVSYVLPAGLLFLAVYEWPHRVTLLLVTLVATLLQAVPLRLAYSDENDPVHSTRLASASWIDSNIPAGESVCVGTPGPYDVPPFRFDRYAMNAGKCRWKVAVEREPDALAQMPHYKLVRRFRPRLSFEAFPLVFGHINPQVSVYRL